ncbi:MAG: SusC/RagA family TonB-linked outer membrane protein [Chitinophagaceae bacterium]|jgi:TonB-linked SusC/RagA family outer membrane protein|nr:SusC/RagA family TonB-linked outer membrane protein [Chitinophagaceae bacterium]
MEKLLLFMCMGLCTLQAMAQNRTISGTVTDEKGNRLERVSVFVKGTQRGTATKDDGTFILSVPANTVALVFGAVGFKTVEMNIADITSPVNVTMAASVSDLDEVMVVAYGTAKKGTYTGAASVIKQSEIKDIPSTSFQNALVGKAPGVQITTPSGQAGTAPSIHIRGIGSMLAGNEPLYVIDGVPVVAGDLGGLSSSYAQGSNVMLSIGSNNVMNSLNPADIESITVLKDAAASALYGSRAANGVIVIQTKRGKRSKPVVNLTSSVGLTPAWATDEYKPADPQAQINMQYMYFWSQGKGTGLTDADATTYALNYLNSVTNPAKGFAMHGYEFSTQGTSWTENLIIKGKTDGIVNREGKYFNWDKAYFGTGIYQTDNLSVSGGDQNTTYFTSVNYTRDQNRIKLNYLDRFAGRGNITQKVGKILEFSTNIAVIRNNQSGYDEDKQTQASYFYQVHNLLWPFYWPTNYKTGDVYTTRYGSLANNALYYNNHWNNNSITTRFSGSEAMTVNFLPVLNLKSIFSYDNTNIKDHVYYDAIHPFGQGTNGWLWEGSTTISKLVSSTTLNYAEQFGRHSLALLGGFEAENNKTDFQRVIATNFPSTALSSLSAAGTPVSVAGYPYGNTMASVLSRAEYNYNQKYFASASYRRDGSSKLAAQTRWGNFWSVAGAWKISGEDFMKTVSVISNLRLRASYGANGTLPPDDYGWRSLTAYNLTYAGNPGGYPSVYGNPNLTWETNYTTNVGLEFGLFNQRLTGSVEYFNRNTKNLLQNTPISMTTGFSNALQNVGEMNNKGIEIELSGDIINKNGLRWSASVNASFIKSKITKLYGGQDIVWIDPTDPNNNNRAQYVYRVGAPTLSFYGYEWGGVDQQNGHNIWYINDPSGPTAGGTITYKGRAAIETDVTNQTAYTKAHYIIMGNAMPTVAGGFSTDVAYKSFTLTLNFIYKLGGNLYDAAFKDVADDGYYSERIRSKYYYDNMWTPTNTKGTLPPIDGTFDHQDPMQYSTRQLHSASFARLKDVNLAYSLPASFIGKAHISSARVFFNGSNLLTVAAYKIADPEVNQYGTRGWETPIGKVYTFGIDVNF